MPGTPISGSLQVWTLALEDVEGSPPACCLGTGGSSSSSCPHTPEHSPAGLSHLKLHLLSINFPLRIKWGQK